MISFENSEVAFHHFSYSDLHKTYRLFKLMSSSVLVKVGKLLLNAAILIKLPISWMLKPTIFKQFCGGETLDEASKTIEFLKKYNVKAILDYSVEGDESELSFDKALNETLATINFAKMNKEEVPFTVFKPSAFGRRKILGKISSHENLSESELQEFEKFKARIEIICKKAFESDVPVMIDAEHYYYQPIIDIVCENMMEQFNQKKAIVYNTLQMYRTDRLDFLNKSLKKADEKGYFLGIKFVRGAYMEKERARALLHGYSSPIHPDKPSTDHDFDAAISFSVENINKISIFCGTHNEKSNLALAKKMEEKGISKDDPRIWFSQLYGMSDNISFNLSHEGYNVAKYIPYGPIKQVLPYLIRRAEENTSVKGQTSRELSLIRKEINRRKNSAKG